MLCIKTWGCFGIKHGGVLVQNMGMFLPLATAMLQAGYIVLPNKAVEGSELDACGYFLLR